MMKFSGPMLGVAMFAATAAAAQDRAPAVDPHIAIPDELIVTAPFARERHILPTAIGVLSGDRLLATRRATIGETLAAQPGVSSTWFGPSSSRPVLRGMQGERVRVLTDGIGSFDVSNTSADHAVAINPLLAERIEIVRGPASLLYGSSAIGGVVNVLDKRIPRQLPREIVHMDASGGFGTAAKERVGALVLDIPLGGGVVFHGDGSYLKTGDMRPGGYIYSETLRAEAAAAGGDAGEESLARGRMPNTHARTWDAAAGLSFFRDGGNFGFAVSRLASNYGIPNALSLDDHDHHHDPHDHDHDHDHHDDHDHGHAHDHDIRLDLRQTRVDARAEIPLQGLFREMRLRFGWADYRHDEIEASGEIGTRFSNKGLEARAEFVQEKRGGWEGALGVQYLSRDFDARGAEAYIPRNGSEQFGLFALQQFVVGTATAELGARWEHARVSATTVGFDRDYDAFSVSGGISVPLATGLRIAFNVSRNERAPAAEELLAGGAHLATRTYAVGDTELKTEKSVGAEAVLRATGAAHRLEISGYFTHFDDYIALVPTGAEIDSLPVYRAWQQDARIWGLEAEGAFTLLQSSAAKVEITGLADFVRAKMLAAGGPVPRIPPLRFIGGISVERGAWAGRVEVEHATRQKRLAQFETPTPAHTLLNASLSWHVPGLDEHSVIILSANNIFDVDARRHASYLKDIAPLPGRDIRLSLRFTI